MAYSIFVELTPPSLRDTSPIFCLPTKHRGRILTPSYRIILANKIDCVYPSSPYCISHKVTEGFKATSHQSVYIGYILFPLPYPVTLWETMLAI